MGARVYARGPRGDNADRAIFRRGAGVYFAAGGAVRMSSSVSLGVAPVKSSGR
jgi:hypothetical protein